MVPRDFFSLWIAGHLQEMFCGSSCAYLPTHSHTDCQRRVAIIVCGPTIIDTRYRAQLEFFLGVGGCWSFRVIHLKFWGCDKDCIAESVGGGRVYRRQKGVKERKKVNSRRVLVPPTALFSFSRSSLWRPSHTHTHINPH